MTTETAIAMVLAAVVIFAGGFACGALWAAGAEIRIDAKAVCRHGIPLGDYCPQCDEETRR